MHLKSILFFRVQCTYLLTIDTFKQKDHVCLRLSSPEKNDSISHLAMLKKEMHICVQVTNPSSVHRNYDSCLLGQKEEVA